MVARGAALAALVVVVALAALAASDAHAFRPSDEAVDALLGLTAAVDRRGASGNDAPVYETKYDADGSHMTAIFFGDAPGAGAEPVTSGFLALSGIVGVAKRSLVGLSSLEAADAFKAHIAGPFFGVDAGQLVVTAVAPIDSRWTRVTYAQRYEGTMVFARTLSLQVSAADMHDPLLKAATGLLESDDALRVARHAAGGDVPSLDEQAVRDAIVAAAIYSTSIAANDAVDVARRATAVPGRAAPSIDDVMTAVEAAFSAGGAVTMGYTYAAPRAYRGGARQAADMMDASRTAQALVLAVATPTVALAGGGTVSARVTFHDPATLLPLAYVETDANVANGAGDGPGEHTGLERIVIGLPATRTVGDHMSYRNYDAWYDYLLGDALVWSETESGSVPIYQYDPLDFDIDISSDVVELLRAEAMFYAAVATMSGGAYYGADGVNGTYVSTLIPSTGVTGLAYATSTYAAPGSSLRTLVGDDGSGIVATTTYARSGSSLRGDYFPAKAAGDTMPVDMMSAHGVVWHENAHVVQFHTTGLTTPLHMRDIDGTPAPPGTAGVLGSEAFLANSEFGADMISMLIDIIESEAVRDGLLTTGIDHMDAQSPASAMGAFADYPWDTASDLTLRDPTRTTCPLTNGAHQGNVRFTVGSGSTSVVVASGLYMSPNMVTALDAGDPYPIGLLNGTRTSFSTIDTDGGDIDYGTGAEFVVATMAGTSIFDGVTVTPVNARSQDLACNGGDYGVPGGELFGFPSVENYANMAGRWVIYMPQSAYFDAYTPEEIDSIDTECYKAVEQLTILSLIYDPLGLGPPAGIIYIKDLIDAPSFNSLGGGPYFEETLGSIPVISTSSAAFVDIYNTLIADGPITAVYTDIDRVTITKDTFVYHSGNAKLADPSTRWAIGTDVLFGRHWRDYWAPNVCANGVGGLFATDGGFPCQRVLPGQMPDGVTPSSADAMDRYHSLQSVGVALASATDGADYGTVTGMAALDVQKTTHIFWRYTANYVHMGMGYAETVDGLYRACLDLVGEDLATISVVDSTIVYADPPLRISGGDCFALNAYLDETGFRSAADVVCPIGEQIAHYLNGLTGENSLALQSTYTNLQYLSGVYIPDLFCGAGSSVYWCENPQGLFDLWVPRASARVRPMSVEARCELGGKRERELFFDGIERGTAPVVVDPLAGTTVAAPGDWLSLSAATNAANFALEEHLPTGVLNWHVVNLVTTARDDGTPEPIAPRQLDPTSSNGRYAYHSNRYTPLELDRLAVTGSDPNRPGNFTGAYAQHRALVTPEIKLRNVNLEEAGAGVFLDLDLFVRTEAFSDGAEFLILPSNGAASDDARLLSIDALLADAIAIPASAFVYNGPNSCVGLYDYDYSTPRSYNIGPVSPDIPGQEQLGDVCVYWGNWDYFGVNPPSWMPVRIDITALLPVDTTSFRAIVHYSEDTNGQQAGISLDNVGASACMLLDDGEGIPVRRGRQYGIFVPVDIVNRGVERSLRTVEQESVFLPDGPAVDSLGEQSTMFGTSMDSVTIPTGTATGTTTGTATGTATGTTTGTTTGTGGGGGSSDSDSAIDDSETLAIVLSIIGGTLALALIFLGALAITMATSKRATTKYN
jgi:hypothetical protein